MEHEDDVNTNWCAWNNLRMYGKGSGKVGNRRTSRDHSNYSIVKIGQNIEKSPGNLRRLAVTKTQKKLQLML